MNDFEKINFISDEEYDYTVDYVLKPELIFKEAIKRGASDIIILPNSPIGFKIKGKYYGVSRNINFMEVTEIIKKVVTNDIDRNVLGNINDLDFSLGVKVLKDGKVILFSDKTIIDEKEIINGEGARFRGVVFKQRNGTFGVSFRRITFHIPSFKELNLPEELIDVINYKQGLIIVSGPTGSGKSTTIASMLDYRIKNKDGLIYTIEDPIEYVFNSNPKSGCFVTQREFGKDVISWENGLKSALRSNPSVIFIGEMRTPEVIQIVPLAAETGHLVVSTIHAKSAPEVITRMIEVLPEESKNLVSFVLAKVIVIVIYQILVPTVDGNLIPALEWFRNDNKISNLISQATKKSVVNEIRSIMELTTNLEEGKRNMTMEQYLFDLYKKGIITKETAIAHAIRKDIMESFFKRI